MNAQTRQEPETMDIQQILTTAGVGGSVGVLASMVTDWVRRKQRSDISEAVFEERLRTLKEEVTRAKTVADGDLTAVVSELKTFSAMVIRLQSSQDVTNVMTAKALDAVLNRCDRMEHRIAEHEQTAGLMTELLEQLKKQVRQ